MMEKPLNRDENYDVGYRKNDHLAIETPENSPFSGDSFAYLPSDSDASNFSLDDHCYASEPSPSWWPAAAAKPAGANRAFLSGVGMNQQQQQRNSLGDHDDDNDLLCSGWILHAV